MFYDMNLLCHQRRGKFASVWIAATRGIIHLKKIDIDKVKIIEMCDEILKYVMSESNSPRNRLSLCLSAKLVYGTILIYQKQIYYLQSSVLYFSVCIRRPTYRYENDDDDADGRNKNKKTKTKKTKKPDEQIAEDMLVRLDLADTMQALAEPNENATDIIHITLPEEVSTRLNIQEKEVDFFGDEGQVDNELQQLREIQWFPALEEEPQPIPPVNRLSTTIADKRQITSVEDVQESPSKRRKSESVGSTDKDRTLMPPPSTPRRTRARTELTDAEIRENLNQPSPTRPSVISPRRKPKAQRALFGDCQLTPSKWQKNELFLDPNLMYKRRDQRLSLDSAVDIRKQMENTEGLIREIFGDISEQNVISVIRDIKDEVSLEHSKVKELRSPRNGKNRRTLDPEIITPSDIKPEPIFLTSPRLSRIPVDSIDRAPLLESFVTENIVAEIHGPRIPEHLASAPTNEDESRCPRVHTSTPILFDTESRRHADLLKIIREIFGNNNRQPITLQDICTSLTKRNVARTFNALLHLQRQQFIKLVKHFNSLELENIIPGPRI